eukprot:jgi/Mesvir1/13336/Mv20268-RA.1
METVRAWVFVDLDQCAKDACCIDTSRCSVVGYCGKAYEGPVPAQCDVKRSDSMNKEAADTLFHYDLGKRMATGQIDPSRDHIYVLSRDAAWHNAGYHLREDGVVHAKMCTAVRELPEEYRREEKDSLQDVLASGPPLPKSSKGVENYVMNNVPPALRELARAEILSRMNRSEFLVSA